MRTSLMSTPSRPWATGRFRPAAAQGRCMTETVDECCSLVGLITKEHMTPSEPTRVIELPTNAPVMGASRTPMRGVADGHLVVAIQRSSQCEVESAQILPPLKTYPIERVDGVGETTRKTMNRPREGQIPDRPRSTRRAPSFKGRKMTTIRPKDGHFEALFQTHKSVIFCAQIVTTSWP